MSVEKLFNVGRNVALATGLLFGGIALQSYVSADTVDKQGHTELANDLESNALIFGSLAVAEFGAAVALGTGSASVRRHDQK